LQLLERRFPTTGLEKFGPPSGSVGWRSLGFRNLHGLHFPVLNVEM
jgi:hypothetical protein